MGEGRAFALRGLPPDDALVLLERELGPALGEEDRPAAEALCAALEGHPLRLLQLAALVRDDGLSLTEVAERVRLHAGSAGEALAYQVLDERSERERRVMAALAIPAGASIRVQGVNALTGLSDTLPVLESLARRGLVREDDRGYTLDGSLADVLGQSEDLAVWADRALQHFADWAERHLQDLDTLVDEAGSILGILEWGARAGSWVGVLRLGRAVEGAFVVDGRWGAWERILGWELEAARAQGDRVAEGWSLHQLGTRALCLDDAPQARENLTTSLHLRESLGDSDGAAVTRHNLRLLDGQHGTEGDDGGSSWWKLTSLWLGAIALVFALVLLGAATLGTERADNGIFPSILPDPLQRLLGGSGGWVQNGGDDGGQGGGSEGCPEGESRDETGECVPAVDNERPMLKLPSDIAFETSDDSPYRVTFSASATDNVDGSVEVICDPPSGSSFPSSSTGTTTPVNCSARDASGNEAEGGFAVIGYYVPSETTQQRYYYYFDSDGDGVGAGEPRLYVPGREPDRWVTPNGDPCPDDPDDLCNGTVD